MSTSHRLSSDELQLGLVLHLDPAILEHEGGESYPPSKRRVEGDHYFLCIHSSRGLTCWVPLSSKDRRGRIRLSPFDKYGHVAWTRRSSYAIVAQFWLAPAEAVLEAAACAFEQSRPGHRNGVSPGVAASLRDLLISIQGATPVPANVAGSSA